MYNEIKQTISQRTGIPAELLKGDTPDELLTYAKALLTYRKEQETEQPKSTREQFAEWYNATAGNTSEYIDIAKMELVEMGYELTMNGNISPRVKDAGEVTNLPDPRTPREQFGDWLKEKTTFDPKRSYGDGGWKSME